MALLAARPPPLSLGGNRLLVGTRNLFVFDVSTPTNREQLAICRVAAPGETLALTPPLPPRHHAAIPQL